MQAIPTDTTGTAPEIFSFHQGYILLISLVTALGGLLFGFDLAIVSGTIRYFSDYFHLSAVGTGWAVGCINLGAVLGAVVSGQCTDRFGRKKVLLTCACLFAVTGVGTGWAPAYPLFISFRILSGAAIGMAALVCPMYIAEVSPAKFRGRLVSFYQLAITIGILLAYLSNYLLLDTGADNWRWMFSSQSVPALLFFLALFTLPESPRWLIRKGREVNALQTLEKIGGKTYARTELSLIRDSFHHQVTEKISTLFSRTLRPILGIGILVAVFSQLVGQNAIFSYAPEIFSQTGVSVNSAFLQSVILGLLNLVFTFVSIATIDRVGRKSLLSWGALLLFVDAMAIAATFYFNAPAVWTLVFVLAFVAIYAATLGPATWVALSELFPNRVRGNAMSLATLCLWFSNFFSVSTFPFLRLTIGLPATYALYGGLCLVYFVFLRISFPETKGQSLEAIEKLLTRSPGKGEEKIPKP